MRRNVVSRCFACVITIVWFISAPHGVLIFAEPPFLGELIDPVQLRGVEDVILDGDRAFLPCREGSRLTICSIKDPTRLEILGTFPHPDLDQAAGFALDGDTAFLASHVNHTLLILDVANAANMKLLGKVQVGNGPGGLYKVAYRDGYCYAAVQQAKRLYVVDVRDSSRPMVVSEVQVTTGNDGPFSVALRDQYALVGTLFGERNRLAVVDIHNPLEPRLVNAVFDPDLCQVSGKFVDNLYVTVCWNENSLLVFDVSDPAKPNLLGKLVDPRLGKPNRLEVVGGRAYLPMVEGNGVAVVDISDPSRPRFVTSMKHPTLKKTYGIAARGDLLFVGSREGNSLVVLDRHVLE